MVLADWKDGNDQYPLYSLINCTDKFTLFAFATCIGTVKYLK